LKIENSKHSLTALAKYSQLVYYKIVGQILRVVVIILLILIFKPPPSLAVETGDTGGGPAPQTNPYNSPIECNDENSPFCLSTQPCTDAGCQEFNCRENDGVYRCLPPISSDGKCGDDSGLTDNDRCLYSQLCDPANSECKVYSCGLVANLDKDKFKKTILQTWTLEIEKYDTICSPQSDKPKPEEPDPSPPPPPCSKGFDKEGNLTTDEKQIKICTSVTTGLGIDIGTDPSGLIKSIFGIILSLSGGLALLLIIYSGYQLIAARGKPEALEAARDQLIAAIIGLVFIIFSFVILQVIGFNILRIPDFIK